ncbi:MAG: tellurite resistance protein TerC [bacterium P3]|nr:MAG: tellurite resistance protein TerC [bacterium P3]KWW41937.1 MAG: tellurite resistance protein TerC [bacterium F083]
MSPFFIFFLLFIVAMLALDLGLFHKDDHVVGMREAGAWTLVWVSLAMLFALLIRLKGEWLHGIENMEDLMAYAAGSDWEAKLSGCTDYAAALDIYRREVCGQYLAGYFIEESLSIDNIFVMIMIFASFGVRKEYYHRVLFWGILGAIVLRFLFIFALGALVNQFSWLLVLFGVVLLYSSVKMFADRGDRTVDTDSHPVVRFAARHFRVSPGSDGHNFFTRIDGKRYITPLFLVLLVIEFSDIIFAVDSIPAVFSVSTDTMVVYTSNIFAIMGLRSLFFLLSDISDRFWMLHYGLGALLAFIGLKMIVHELLHVHISTGLSLTVILSILVLSVLLSVLIPKRKPAR